MSKIEGISGRVGMDIEFKSPKKDEYSPIRFNNTSGNNSIQIPAFQKPITEEDNDNHIPSEIKAYMTTSEEPSMKKI